MDKPIIRSQLRHKRSQLSDNKRLAASYQVLQHLLTSGLLSSKTRCGVYAAVGHELDLQPVIDWFWRQNLPVYLPKINQASEFEWAVCYSHTPWELGAFGIPEPVSDNAIIDALDVCLVPCVGYDQHGVRLGQGGGFYDKLMKKSREQKNKTRFIGAAFSCQVKEALPRDDWDMLLNAVVTEEKYELLVNEI